MNEQIDVAFDVMEFAENPEPRVPVVLLIDKSGSMNGQPIEELNNGIKVLWEEINADTLASKRAEISVIEFGPVRTSLEFATISNSFAPTFEAGGVTPMGEAIVKGIASLQERKRQYSASGIAYYRPWLMLITDGAPTDNIEPAVEAIRRGEQEGALSFFAIGVQGADMQALNRLNSGKREALKLDGLNFKELFLWLSASVRSVSQSSPGDIVPLPSPMGWTAV
jgi:uncharacterized protein YegL